MSQETQTLSVWRDTDHPAMGVNRTSTHLSSHPRICRAFSASHRTIRISCGTGGDPVSRTAQTPLLPAICVPTVHRGPSGVAGGWAWGRDASLPGETGRMLGGDRSTRTDGCDGCSQSENRTRRSPSAGAEPPDTPGLQYTRSPLRGLALSTVRSLDAELGSGSTVPQPSTMGPLAGSRQHPHHVKLVQAQPVDARPLTVHGLPEGLKEQVL